MSYGHFSSDGREYIITRPDTPRPWVNYLFNHSYHAIVSQTGGGFSYCRDPKFNRVHKYERMVSDRPGRYLYCRDKESGETWSANWQPMMRPFQEFETRHGLGYTVIRSRYFDIEVRMTFFVPLDSPCEVCRVEVKNHSGVSRSLQLFPFVDFVAGDAQLEIDYPNILSLYNRSFFDAEHGAIIAYKQPHPGRELESCAFFASSASVSGFECAREAFLGRYGSLSNPKVVQDGKCSDSTVCGEDMVGVFEHQFEIAANESDTFVLLTGFVDDEAITDTNAPNAKESFYQSLPSAACKRMIKNMMDEFLSEKQAADELKRIDEYWQQQTSSLVVETPDAEFNRMTNIWGRYQLFGITHWRGTSAYHNAEGGRGYRDTAQDAVGILALDAVLAKSVLEKLLRYQYANGHAVSGFSDKEGSWETQGQAVVTGKSDMAVWLVYAVVAYLEETGDLGFLDKRYPFLDKGEASVYAHCLRALEFLTRNLGSNGLPLIGKADWNDAYDRLGYRGKGESLWLAMAIVRALNMMIQVSGYIGDDKKSLLLNELAENLQSNIRKFGWDGNWFIAAINDNGFRVGSIENSQGKLPLNSQTWAVLSGIVDSKQGHELAELVDRELDTEYGPALFSPEYRDYHPGIGRVTSFAPGTKENAAVFSHAAAFKVVADCVLKRGNKAYDTFRKVMPGNPRKADADLHKVEPYVYAEYIVGPGHPTRFGEGGFTWNTGTAPWMFMAATEWICGARRTLDGLLIDPCIPAEWKEFKIVRPFRNAIYQIIVRNPGHVESGVVQMKVDGIVAQGQLISPHEDGREHLVEVLLGK